MRAAAQGLRRHLRHPAVWIFLSSRAAIWLGVVFALLWFTPSAGRPRQHVHELGYAVDVWVRWDSEWYLAIARSGYHDVTSAAFYPLYPAVVGGLGRVLGGHYVLAGVVISLAACLGAFRLLWALAEQHLGADGASRAVLYLAVFPMSLFLGAVYNESLYLLLTLGAFTFATRGRFLGAAVAAGAAMLTRSAGLAVLPALAVLAWRQDDRRRALAALMVAPLIFLIWPLWLWHAVGDPLAFVHAQKDWGRHLSAAGPFGGLLDGFNAARDGLSHIRYAHAPTPRIGPDQTSELQIAIQNVEAFAFAVTFIVLAALTWRRFGAAYGLFAVTSLAIALAVPTALRPLLSLPRFGLAIFPLFLALAAFSEKPRMHLLLLLPSTIFCGIALAQWAHYEWVS